MKQYDNHDAEWNASVKKTRRFIHVILFIILAAMTFMGYLSFSK